MSPSRLINSLQFLAVKEVVKILFAAAEREEDNFLNDVLKALQHLGLFSDIFLHSMHYLQQQFDAHHLASRNPRRKKMERLDSAVKILLPTLLDSRLTVLNLRCQFIQSSPEAKTIVLGSIRHLPYLFKVDVTGFCTDELAVQLGLHCRHLKQLSASGSRGLTDIAISAITGMAMIDKQFVPGCKKLKRLDIYNCPLISTSKIVSALLTLPDLTFLSTEKLPQVFESSALFESGLQFRLTNFEHEVTHLERAREKINHHLNSEDQFLIKVNEIFPDISMVKLTLSHLFDDTSTLYQLSAFQNIHTLILEQPVGNLDENFRLFLMEKGHQLRKLCIRAHSARLADLAAIFDFCNGLRVFQFFSMVLESSMENFNLVHSINSKTQMESRLLPDLSELRLGCTKHITLDQNEFELESGFRVFSTFLQDLLLRTNRIRSVVISGCCCSWITDGLLQTVVRAKKFEKLRRFSVTGKSSLSMQSGKLLLCQCSDLVHLMIKGWNVGTTANGSLRTSFTNV